MPSSLTALAIGAMVTLLPIAATAADGIRVRDGDTVVTPDGTAWRLAGIQAPERKQALYDEAKQRMYQIAVSASEFTCEQRAHETSYDRLVGFCRADGQDVAEVLLREGLVCTWKQYHPPPQYLEAEQEAKSKAVGMWSLPRVQRNRACR